MNVTVNPGSVASLKQALNDTTRKLQAELRVAVNATARKSKSLINKEIRTELAVTAKVVKSTISIKTEAKGTDLTATVEVKKTARIPLRDFGARQNKTGVSAKISKSKGRKDYPGAFQGPKPGAMKISWRGRVFVRTGATRLPIVQLFGPSPWGVMTKGDKLGPSEEQIQAELSKQIERRVRFITLKKTGAI